MVAEENWAIVQDILPVLTFNRLNHGLSYAALILEAPTFSVSTTQLFENWFGFEIEQIFFLHQKNSC